MGKWPLNSFIQNHLLSDNSCTSQEPGDSSTWRQCLKTWLPIRHRTKFKMAVLVYKCLHGMAPSYCTPITSQTGRSNLRYATTGQLIVPRTRTAYGSRSFAVHDPVVWNSLSAELRSPDISLDISENSWRLFCLTADSIYAEFSNLG